MNTISKQAKLPIVEIRSARTFRGTPQLREEPLHPLPRSVGVINARQLVQLELDQSFQVFSREHAALPAAVKKMAEESDALDRLRAAAVRRTFESLDSIEAVHGVSAFPFGPGKSVAPHEPREGEGKVRIAAGELP